MGPLYVIVHQYVVVRDMRSHPIIESVRAELRRIAQEEEYVHVTGNPSIMPDIPDSHGEILVCGAYYSGKQGKEKCVDSQLETLLKAGYDAKIYPPATLPFWLHENRWI